jgi:hypothetical protein
MDSTVAYAERAVQALSPEELAQFRQWFATFDANNWDAKIDTDAREGKLDALAAEALSDFASAKPRAL